MYAGYLQVFGHGPLVDLAHTLERDGGGLYDLRVGAGVFQDTLVYEAPGPDHHVRLADELSAANGQQIRRPRPRPDEPDLTQTPASSS
jgi:hypothetical protein